MGSSVQEKEMHYPVMTEKHPADRWQVSLKTLRRWRLDGEGPVWHKLFRQVRYHDADVLKFEQRSAQHLMTMLSINREFKPAEPEATLGQDLGAEAESTTSQPRKSPRQHRCRSTCSAIRQNAIASACRT